MALRGIRKPARLDREARAARIGQLMHQIKEETSEEEANRLPGKAFIDWEAVRDFYLNYEGDIDLLTVAKQFGISPSAVYNKSSKEGWRDLRTMAQAKQLRDRRAERSVMRARKSQEFDDKAYQVAQLGLTLVTGRMAQIADQFAVQRAMYQSALERVERGEKVPKTDLYSAVNYRELVELARALETYQMVGRRATGTDIQTVHTIIDSAIEAEQSKSTSTVAEELVRPDEDRLAALVDALVDANFMELKFGEDGEVVGLGIIEGQVVEGEAGGEQLAIES